MHGTRKLTTTALERDKHDHWLAGSGGHEVLDSYLTVRGTRLAGVHDIGDVLVTEVNGHELEHLDKAAEDQSLLSRVGLFEAM